MDNVCYPIWHLKQIQNPTQERHNRWIEKISEIPKAPQNWLISISNILPCSLRTGTQQYVDGIDVEVSSELDKQSADLNIWARA